MPKVVLALLAQFAGLLSLFGLVSIAPNWIEPPYGAFWLVLGQSFLALGFTIVSRMNRWWWLIQFSLPWLWYWALLAEFDPWLSLGLFVLIVLVFANAFSDRVPLYLTNTMTRKALKKIALEELDVYRPVKFLDVGSGLGGNVFYMANLPKVVQSTGVETAPIPLFIALFKQWLNQWRNNGRIAKFTSRSKAAPLSDNGRQNDLPQSQSNKPSLKSRILGQDLWKHSLIEYDLVYAFLSPEPMPKLWQKVLMEMPENGLFVSNSFPVPGVEPSDIWQLNDSRQTILYLYKVGDFVRAN